MFGANETPYDLRFRLLGIPVRVHPFFWVISAMLGWKPENLPLVAIWVACVFVSIVVHEYGHGLTARAFGTSPSIVLHGFGGLCKYPNVRHTPWQRLAVLIWGPGAGFVFCLLVMLGFSAAYGLTIAEHIQMAKAVLWMQPDYHVIRGAFEKLGLIMAVNRSADVSPRFAGDIYWFLIQINLCWGLINLLPIWPLDGGQLTETVITELNPYNGRRWTHTISLVCSGVLAIFVYTRTQALYNALIFAYFFLINYQMLDMIHRAQVMGVYDEDLWQK